MVRPPRWQALGTTQTLDGQPVIWTDCGGGLCSFAGSYCSACRYEMGPSEDWRPCDGTDCPDVGRGALGWLPHDHYRESVPSGPGSA